MLWASGRGGTLDMVSAKITPPFFYFLFFNFLFYFFIILLFLTLLHSLFLPLLPLHVITQVKKEGQENIYQGFIESCLFFWVEMKLHLYKLWSHNSARRARGLYHGPTQSEQGCCGRTKVGGAIMDRVWYLIIACLFFFFFFFFFFFHFHLFLHFYCPLF